MKEMNCFHFLGSLKLQLKLLETKYLSVMELNVTGLKILVFIFFLTYLATKNYAKPLALFDRHLSLSKPLKMERKKLSRVYVN